MTDRYLDDLTVGESWTSEPFTMTEAEIIAFATEFDPQPMHIDKAAAEAGRFGGLIASGWHVCSRVMRHFVDEAYFGDTPLLGMNVDALWWVQEPARSRRRAHQDDRHQPGRRSGHEFREPDAVAEERRSAAVKRRRC